MDHVCHYKNPNLLSVSCFKYTYLLAYLLTYLLTYFMVQDILLKTDCLSACQKISRLLMEPEGSLPCSQKLATGPYSEPDESSLPHRSRSL